MYSGNRDVRQLGLELSKWLKQVSILAFPQHQPQSFTGEPWLKFLDQSIGGNDFSSGHGKVFGGSIYRQQVNLDAQQLVELCEQWLNSVKPPSVAAGQGLMLGFDWWWAMLLLPLPLLARNILPATDNTDFALAVPLLHNYPFTESPIGKPPSRMLCGCIWLFWVLPDCGCESSVLAWRVDFTHGKWS